MHLFRVCLVLASTVALAWPVSAHEFEEEELIVALVPGASIDAFNVRWGTTTLDIFPSGNLYLVDTQGATQVEELSDVIEAGDPEVLYAEANYVESTPESVRQMVWVAVGGTITDFEDQEIASRIGIDLAHATTTGEGAVVAVIDTGIDFDHPIFIDSLLPGYDFIDRDSDPSEVANTVDDDGDGVTDAGYGHGTMVAGIVSLVAPGAKILPIRALDDEGRSNAWILSVATRYAVEQGVDVINMSFGVPVEIDALKNEISNAYDHNVMVVAAAGNEAREEPAYHPAIDGKAFMVIAVDENDVKADFSDWNDDVTVSAPGTGVRSAHPDGWALGSGCSFAAPFVAGEVALIRSRSPGIDHGEVERILEAAVDPIDQLPGNELYAEQIGSGRVYLPRALDGTVAAPDAPAVDGFRLFPNPARSVVLFQGESLDRSRITVFDVTGRAVARLARGERSWDVTTSSGARVAPGTYYVRVTGPTTITRSVKVLP